VRKGESRSGRFGRDALRAKASLAKEPVIHFGTHALTPILTSSACGHPVDVAFATSDPLEVTCFYCLKADACLDAPVPYVLAEDQKKDDG